MAGTARVAARMAWRVGRLVEIVDETATARTLVLDVPGWPGHLAGQRVDVRLTAEDGYRASRAYSLAAPAAGDRVEITVQRVPDGEVSPYLTEVFTVGDPVELRGPIGGWFVWQPDGPAEPVLLVAGGSGIVPLMAMIRARRAARSRVPFRLVYSLRGPDEAYYASELRGRGRGPGDGGLDVAYVYTRSVPEGWRAAPRRITAGDLAASGWPADLGPTCYVCGPTGFVETVANLLVTQGHDPSRVRTERFGPTGR
ncbi:ferredoxin reductase [Frankia sp. CNm7]|uniref:Ferredoxin reductase n=1 Tax=Frankia nepalensis TaxID=1836974 RepID=A0A937RU54_9ACTN|nr:ferredoxin reductase [Frankia nepalensis]MBL7497482.1 ferredoxin reductase [Frankia nepalensis]MBL7509577.1 ferredoxin reductase [Frankia nepalensis]MBL7517751.1 ferredoxin reductase [Frankia nepalensis]MBL7633384.1 ferredoxin reductase [Frankia nepalensis]